ncbi:hypothetical protein [Thalassoroseus pseudoceratinae]|uniref:hypothetical protein n=1 Tax=Thalassoroseus pseudoceratinae TaxID=2713176 RepID=UPI001423C305|nr:hypothetical protein [Thalassoroseus pseudoceratinae]
MRTIAFAICLCILCGCDAAFFETPPAYETLDTFLKVPPPTIEAPPFFVVDDESQPVPIPDTPWCLGAAIAEPYQRTAPPPFPDQLTLDEINEIIAPLHEPEAAITDCAMKICGDSYTYVGEVTTDWLNGPVVVTCGTIFTDRGERITQFIINRQRYLRRSLHTNVLTWWQTYQ